MWETGNGASVGSGVTGEWSDCGEWSGKWSEWINAEIKKKRANRETFLIHNLQK